MENIDRDLEKIEHYLAHKLSQSDRVEVDNRLKKDANFAKLFNKTKQTIKAIRHNAEVETMSFLNQIYQEEKEAGLKFDGPQKNTGGTKIRRLTGRRWIGIAATISLLLVATFWIIQSNGNNTSYFSQYYETPAFDLQRGGNTTELYQQAGNEYSAQNYAAALTKLRQAYTEDPNNTNISILIGVCLLETEQFNEALVEFSALAEKGQQLDQVLWLKSLTEIGLKNNEAASQTLNQLLNGSVRITPNRKAKVLELLEKLN